MEVEMLRRWLDRRLGLSTEVWIENANLGVPELSQLPCETDSGLEIWSCVQEVPWEECSQHQYLLGSEASGIGPRENFNSSGAGNVL